jgi:tetratricopeptide (TPR) repeat protein
MSMDCERLHCLKVCFFLFCLTFSTKAYSQNAHLADSIGIKKIDSLKELALSYAYEHNDFDSAIFYINQMQKLSFQLGDSLRIVKSGRIKANFLANQEKFDSAILLCNSSLMMARRNRFDNEDMYITNTLGTIFINKARYDEALSYLQESLDMRVKHGDHRDVSVALNNIGLIFYKMKSYEKALPYFEKSIKLKEENKDYYDYDIMLLNSGLCHVYLKHYEIAIEIFREGITFFRDSTGLRAKSVGCFGLGVAYYGMNDLKRAEKYFKDSYEFSIADKYFRFQADALVYLGKISFATGRKKKGIDQLVEAETISNEYEYKELLITVFEELIKMFKDVDDIGHLIAYQEKYIKLKEEVYSAIMIENLAAAEVKLKKQENLRLLQYQQETLRVNERLINKNRILIGSSTGLVVLFGLLLYLLYRSNRLSRQMHKELESKVILNTTELFGILRQLEQSHQKQDAYIYHTHASVLSHTMTLEGLNKVMNPNKRTQVNQQIDEEVNRLFLITQSDLTVNTEV